MWKLTQSLNAPIKWEKTSTDPVTSREQAGCKGEKEHAHDINIPM